jgi:hypothetical protein
VRYLLAIFVLLVACSKPALEPDGCPKDLSGAVGKSCDIEGKGCSGGSQMRMISCSHGKWAELEMAPPPQNADPCPPNPAAAVGTPCGIDGKICTGGSDVRMLQCSGGKWNELNSPPMPKSSK